LMRQTFFMTRATTRLQQKRVRYLRLRLLVIMNDKGHRFPARDSC
jgi:hypothetical protein